VHRSDSSSSGQLTAQVGPGVDAYSFTFG
jgi:hypothetical protein